MSQLSPHACFTVISVGTAFDSNGIEKIDIASRQIDAGIAKRIQSSLVMIPIASAHKDCHCNDSLQQHVNSADPNPSPGEHLWRWTHRYSCHWTPWPPHGTRRGRTLHRAEATASRSHALPSTFQSRSRCPNVPGPINSDSSEQTATSCRLRTGLNNSNKAQPELKTRLQNDKFLMTLFNAIMLENVCLE